MVGCPNDLRPWWPTWRPAHRRRHTPTICGLWGKPKKRTPWNPPTAKQLIKQQNPRWLVSSPFGSLRGPQPLVKTHAVCLAHLEEENIEEDDEVPNGDPDDMKGVTEEFMVHLGRAVKDTQKEGKCCYHCSSLNHFIHDCPLVKTSRTDSNLNCKEGMVPKKGAWVPQTKASMPMMPLEGAPKA